MEKLYIANWRDTKDIEEYRVKGLQIASIATFVMVIFFSIGLVSALTSSDATIHATLSNSAPKPGDTILVSVTFQSHVSQELKIYAIGVHADWMQADQLFGPNLSSNPATVESNGVYVTQFTMQVPANVPLGSHTYNVGVDGLDSTGTAFSFDSAQATFQVVAGGSSTTSTPTSTGNSPDGGLSEWLPYLVVVAAAVIVAVLVLFVMMRSKKPRKPAIKDVNESTIPSATDDPKSDRTPDSQEFDI